MVNGALTLCELTENEKSPPQDVESKRNYGLDMMGCALKDSAAKFIRTLTP